MITLTNLTVRKKSRTIIDDVTLQLPDSGHTIVIGPNGSGKTTLLRAMFGLERVAAGQVAWAGSVPADHAFVFQSPTVLQRSVRDNIAYPLHLLGWSRRDIMAAADDWLHRIGLHSQADLAATRLSGGERQKLAIARALIRNPKVIFLDEPCANLDGQATRDIEDMLSETLQSGTRIIMSTHNMGQAVRLATDAVFMLHGRMHENGMADILITQAKTPELNAFLKGDILL